VPARASPPPNDSLPAQLDSSTPFFFPTTLERSIQMTSKPQQIRQGDVQLQPVASLPDGCKEVPNDKGRIVLAYGEVTGHAHAIADHRPALRAGEIAEAAIARARLFVAPSGERFLEVRETVTLRHEEHTAHTLNPGIYKLPVQVEYTPSELRRVED
jgi:hypothetical protein